MKDHLNEFEQPEKKAFPFLPLASVITSFIVCGLFIYQQAAFPAGFTGICAGISFSSFMDKLES